MSIVLRRWAAAALGIVLLTFLSACVVPGGGHVQGSGVVYGVNYYEPAGHDYGGWAPHYNLGPPRGGGPGPDHARHEASPQQTYRPAPASRPIPSLPTHPRSDAEHGNH